MGLTRVLAIQVLGMDVDTEMDAIRKHMGVCPQHDCLWDELTVHVRGEAGWGETAEARIPWS